MTDLLPVDEAIARIVAGVTPLAMEVIALDAAEGRTLAAPLSAKRTQPPFDASAMDGYAVRAVDLATPPARLRLIGTAAAGAGFAGTVGPNETVRILTGAPVPAGADSVLIQENAEATDATTLVAKTTVKRGQYVRPAGLDFRNGAVLLAAGVCLGMREIALAAAMGHASLPVRARPRIAIASTGDELVAPGIMPTGAQIVAASAPGLAAYVRTLGAEPHDLGLVTDDLAAIGRTADAALALGADVLVTLGGASVGDHDLVGAGLAAKGMALDFWKIAMRPGKPLMFGRIGPMRVLGLPGNPVSSLVCAILFLRPLIDALLARPPADLSEPAVLATDAPANDARQDYVRSTMMVADGLPAVTPLPVQDSSMLSVLAVATCLLIRPPNAPAARTGEACRIIRLP
ncbi:MAG TPA: gephyrin-like molybdotransferase Glp [Bauldia sp.]